MSQPEIPVDILALPAADRIKLAAKIWDSVDDAEILSPEQRRILEQRLAEYRANPVGGIVWEELKSKLRRES